MKRTRALALAGLIGATLAGAADAKGPRGSIDIFNQCILDGGTLIVDTTITDTSGDNPDTVAVLGMKTVEVYEKFRRNQSSLLTSASGDASAFNPVIFDLCAAGLSPDARAITVQVSVEVLNGRTVTSRCDDDPATEFDESNIDPRRVLCPVID